jgi:hypothetical protein
MTTGAAPIGLFAYNRPEYIARALRALARCPELAASPLVVFCDGPKDDAGRARVEHTRRVARELAPPHARIIEREHNLGLAVSMRTGVGALCEEFGRAIILEDDLEVAPTFLRFMNDALDRYADEPRVMQVSGYMFPTDVTGPDDALFLPLISCWGWGVWARSWAHLGTGAAMYERMAREPGLRRRFDLDGAFPYFEMLESQRRGELDSWGIGWYLDVFARDGLVLYPRQSLVANRGHDGTGAHREQSSPFEAHAHDFTPRQLPAARLDAAQVAQLRAFIVRASGGFTARLKRFLSNNLVRWRSR